LPPFRLLLPLIVLVVRCGWFDAARNYPSPTARYAQPLGAQT
jgi:hypothetical protein